MATLNSASVYKFPVILLNHTNGGFMTHFELLELLNYDPLSGEFTWRERSAKWFKSLNSMNSTNSRISGVQAGTTRQDKQKNKQYKFIKIMGKTYRSHILAYWYMTGTFPDGQIDHLNHDTLDNRYCNLRLVTRSENSRNLPLYKNNKSGVHGVYPCATGYRVVIGVDGAIKHLGTFGTFDDAVIARRNAEVKYGFHINHGNT